MIAEVGLSISGIPGPPFGPSYLITITSPLLIDLFFIALFASVSQLNTLAFPLKIKPSFPVILATEPSEAKFPYKIRICPEFLIGLLIGLIISCSKSIGLIFFRFSFIVFPVTVKHSS